MISQNKGVALTLISGWGAPVSMIADWTVPLAADVARFSLDDNLLADAESLDDAADRILARTEGRRLLVGWSLGGQIAMAAAAREPDRVNGVLTVASSPCFVARSDWPCGMPAPVFAAFRDGLGRNTQRQWKRFLLLQVRGALDEADARHGLQSWLAAGPSVSERSLTRSLGWLAQCDQRCQWQELAVPSRHLFGEQDALVQADTARGLQSLGLDARLVTDMAHWPYGRTEHCVARHIEEFTREYG